MKRAGRMKDYSRWEHQRRLPEQVVLKADGEQQEGVQQGEMEGSIPVRGDIGVESTNLGSSLTAGPQGGRE